MANGGALMTMLREGKNQQTVGFDLVAAILYFRGKGVVQVPALDRNVRVN